MLTNPRISANLLAKPTRNEPLGLGGPWGGYPLGRSPPRGCIPLPKGGAHGALGPWPRTPRIPSEPLGAMGAMGWPQGPWAPLGGGDTLSRGSLGVSVSPYHSLRMSSPDAPPKYSGTIRGSRRAFYRFFGLSWETSSHSRVLFT